MNYQTLNRATTAALGVIIAGGIFAVVTVGIKLTSRNFVPKRKNL